MNLKQCSIKDLEALREISIATFAQSYRHLNDPINFDTYIEEAFSLEQLREELQNPLSIFYLLKKEEDTLAYIKLNLPGLKSDYEDEEALHLERIYVRELYQGKGIGSALLHQVYELSSKMRFCRIWLGVWKRNIRAITFYERHGFEKKATCTFLLGDEVQEDYVMVKNI